MLIAANPLGVLAVETSVPFSVLYVRCSKSLMPDGGSKVFDPILVYSISRKQTIVRKRQFICQSVVKN